MSLTRAERDRFTALTPADIAYGEGACIETPPRLFDLLHQRFRFDADLTANEQNHVLPIWFGPGSPYTYKGQPANDCLTLPWHQLDPHGRPCAGFSNPPYGPFIPKILKKAIEERTKGFTSVFLLPMRAAGWFRDLVLPYYSELWYCSERIVFHYEGRPRLSAALKATKITDTDPRFSTGLDNVYAAEDLTYTWLDRWNDPYEYEFDKDQQIMVPAGALFDSIIVVYAPYDRAKWGLFPPPQRPNVFEVRTGELRY